MRPIVGSCRENSGISIVILSEAIQRIAKSKNLGSAFEWADTAPRSFDYGPPCGPSLRMTFEDDFFHNRFHRSDDLRDGR